MRERDARKRRRCDGRGNTGHDFERNAGVRECECFLGAAREQQGIATLEPDDALARARESDHFFVDVFLLRAWIAETLAHVVTLRLARGVEERRVGETVVENDVSPPEDVEPAHGDETRITGP